MMQRIRPASALLLTVMVISVLTTTTLGTIAIRFDQLAATDRITSAAKAKLAADSGIVALRNKLDTGVSSFAPEAYDLTKQESLTVPTQGRFRPNPRNSAYSLESQVINLPRCLSVAVLSPWVNTGSYLLSQDESPSNPGLLFYYANIINDTPLGVIGANTGTSGSYSELEKELPISQLTKLGQFYNPYATSGQLESSLSYWTLNLGGPQDQFLYRRDATNQYSLYRGLDFVYIPYLPRFTDSGVLRVASDPNSGLVRKDADTIRNDFENVIRQNNFKVWLDASATNDWLYQFGLGDLFTDPGEEANRLTWLQPSLWGDLPEADTESGYASGLSGPYRASNITGTIASGMDWRRSVTPTKAVGASDGGWQLQIIRGSRSFSFLYPSGDLSRTITPNGSLSLNVYGSMEGLRLNQPITVVALSKANNKPVQLQSRDSASQGRFLQAKIVAINQDGSGEVSVRIQFFNGTYQTPNTAAGTPLRLSEVSVFHLMTGAQYATARSTNAVSLQPDGRSLSFSSSCNYSETDYVVCPAVGDVVSATKAGAEPIWGRVTAVSFDASGRTMNGARVDKYREMPRPVRDIASAVVIDGGVEKIAYYGGAVVANEFDGGTAGVSDQLWLYNPSVPDQNAAWTYLPNNAAGGDPTNLPGARAGATVAFLNDSLYLIGGYSVVGIGDVGLGKPCGDTFYLNSCLGVGRGASRMARTYSNDLFRFNLTTREWTKVVYDTSNASQPSIPNGTWLELKTVSRFSERTGKDGWESRVTLSTNNGASPAIVQTTPGQTSTISVTTSIAGIALGDEFYLSATKSDNSSFVAWGRVVGLPSTTSLQIRLYGNKGASGSANLKSGSISIITRTAGSAKCIWQDATKSCVIDGRTDGIALGDAIVLERLDNYTAPTSLVATYSGYVASLSGNAVTFVGRENLPGFDDYRSGTAVPGESVRLLPIGRSGGRLQVTNGKLYYWQGNQTVNTVHARVADVWEFDPATSRWTPVPLTMSTLPAGSLYFQAVRSPNSATMFTTNVSANNPAMIKDSAIVWDNNGQPVTEYVWDNAKTWTIEIDTESSNTQWNIERVSEGMTMILERQSGAARERFTGIVSSIDPANQSRITLRHHASFSGDTGLAGDSTNARITMSYSSMAGSNAIGAGTITRVDNDTLAATTAAPATELRKIPVGAVVMVYSGGLSGTNENVFTATVDRRAIVGSDRVTFSAAGAAFLPTPLVHPYTANALVGNDAQAKGLISLATYRAREASGGIEWFNRLSGPGTVRKWMARYSSSYVYNGNNRPAPRQQSMLATTADGLTAFTVGGTYGPYTNVWRLGNAHGFGTLPSWQIGKHSPTAANDLPNMYGATADVLSTGEMVVFGGQRRFSSSYLGPKILAQPSHSTGIDGTFSVVDSGVPTSLKSRQFTSTLYEQYDGVAENSLRFTSEPTPSNFTGVCQFIGQAGCDHQLMRSLGTLGRHNASWGNSLAIINPGSGFVRENADKSMILSGPAQSLDRTNGRWDQEGYTPYRCDTNAVGCFNYPFGSLGSSEANATKSLLFAGFSRITGGGSMLVTPVGIGRGVTSGQAGTSYCAQESTKSDYTCKSNSLQARYMKWVPDAEDVLFVFNAAKALSSTDAYRVVGYYGGVARGYLAVSVGDELNIQEIAP